MKRQIAVVMFSAVFGFLTLSSHAMAQQKTATACRDEWRANKAANQANGVTEKAYVAQCRGGAAPAQTTAAPAAPPAPAPTAAPPTGQKTAGACRDEWRANKAANQANGITEKAYVAQCRSGAAPIQTTAAPAGPPAPAPTVAPATGQKTAGACRDEWRANKAANQANGITEKAYVAQCRSGAAPARPRQPPLHLRHPHRPQRQLLLRHQRLPLLRPDPFLHPPQPPGLLPILEIQSGRTNFQPKRRLSTVAPRVPLCG